MSLASSILAYTPLENPGVSDAAPYLTGFLVVLVTLAVLMGLCMAVSKILQQVMPAPAAPQPVAKPAATAPVNDGVPPEIIAVIAAAVATTVGKKQRIVSIKPQNSSWSQAGRQQIHSSHKIR
jgi:sodium pump decarboxylase gamma subunit